MNLNPVQQMLEIFPALYTVLDQQQQFVYVSKASEYLLGYLPSELLGKTLRELLTEEDHSRTLQAIEQLYAGESRPGFISRFRHKNGSLVPLSWYGTIDPQTGWIYGLGQKVMYAAPDHQLSGNSLGSINNTPEGELQIDASLRILFANEAVAAILGKPVSALEGAALLEALPEAGESIFETELKRALHQKKPIRFECFCPSAHQQWLEVAAFPYGEGLSVFIRNIDAQKKAEDELWKLSLIARETTNMVVLTDACGNITWMNNAFTRISGYEITEAIGKPLATFLNGLETDTATILYLEDAIKKSQPFHAEVLQYDKWGRKIWVEMQGQPVRDGNGKVDQFFSIQTDISQRKDFEERLQQEQQQRQRKITRATIEAQERERSLVSQELHDNVNQVLTTVKLYNELCLSGIDQQEDLLQKSVQLLQQSINEIRSLSKRLSAPTLGKFRLRDSVKELTDTIAATNRLHIDTDLSLLNDIEVPQDLHLAIYRILQEHFTNILKHASARNVLVSFETVNDELVLKVRDDGKGFNTHELSGGIGIANMLTRAESMKGTLTLNSAPGLGCVLLVRFPVTF